MRFHRLTFILFVLLILGDVHTSNLGFCDSLKKHIEVTYSKNIELLGIVGNLTPLWEETEPNFPFAAQARQQFLLFRNHNAVKSAEKLIKKRGRRTLALLAFYLSDLPEAKLDYPSLPFYAKWKLEESIPDIKDFYYKSDFERFWLENSAYYSALKSKVEAQIEKSDLTSLFEGYFGSKMDSYVLIFTPQMARFSMGQLVKSGGKKSVSVVFGPREDEMSGQYFIHSEDLLINIIFREFGRLFIGDIVDREEKLIRRYDHLHKKYKNKVVNKDLRSWPRFFFQNMYRAIQSRLVLQMYDEKAALENLEKNSTGDTLLVPLLYELASQYEQNRKKYKDFESYLPDLLASLEGRLKNQ